jgi:hypothetical protein
VVTVASTTVLTARAASIQRGSVLAVSAGSAASPSFLLINVWLKILILV